MTDLFICEQFHFNGAKRLFVKSETDYRHRAAIVTEQIYANAFSIACSLFLWHMTFCLYKTKERFFSHVCYWQNVGKLENLLRMLKTWMFRRKLISALYCWVATLPSYTRPSPHDKNKKSGKLRNSKTKYILGISLSWNDLIMFSSMIQPFKKVRQWLGVVLHSASNDFVPSVDGQKEFFTLFDWARPWFCIEA